MKHEPRGFLSDPKGAAKLARTDTILRRRKEPYGDKPLIQPQGTILKYCSNFSRKLLLTVIALEDEPRFQKSDARRATVRAGHAFRPTKLDHEVEGVFRLCEEGDNLLKCFRGMFLRLHELNIT